MKLSENFKLLEFTRSETAKRLNIDNSPGEIELNNLKRLAGEMEKVRELFGKPIIITSGFRCNKLNSAIGSKPTSRHVLGLACDFFIHGLEIKEIVQIIKDSYLSDLVDQCICEFDDWVHLSIAEENVEPRKMFLTIDNNGTRQFEFT